MRKLISMTLALLDIHAVPVLFAGSGVLQDVCICTRQHSTVT